MNWDVSDLTDQIMSFTPSDGNWCALDSLLEDLFRTGSAALGIDAMLHVFERFPDDDGAGVFWSILHGLESLTGYEHHLIRSIRATPSVFATVMVNRLLNAGHTEVDGVQLFTVLEEVARNEAASLQIRSSAKRFLANQKDKRSS